MLTRAGLLGGLLLLSNCGDMGRLIGHNKPIDREEISQRIADQFPQLPATDSSAVDGAPINEEPLLNEQAPADSAGQVARALGRFVILPEYQINIQ